MSYYSGSAIEVDAFVRVQGSRLAVKADAGATTITVYDASRWAAANVLKLGLGDPQNERTEIVTIQSIAGNVITLPPGVTLLYAYSVDTPVYRLATGTMDGTNKLKAPAGSLSNVTWTNVSTGRERITFTPAGGGNWTIEPSSSGAVVAQEAAVIPVRGDLV